MRECVRARHTHHDHELRLHTQRRQREMGGAWRQRAEQIGRLCSEHTINKNLRVNFMLRQWKSGPAFVVFNPVGNKFFFGENVETAFKSHLNASAVACYTAAHRSPSMARRSLHRPSRRRNCCVFARASAVGHPPSASGRPSALAIPHPHPRYHYYIIIIMIIITLSLLYCIYIIIIIIIIIIILHIYHYHHHYYIARGSSI